VNILLINHYAGSVRHGMEFRPFYLAREWVRSGHKVHILAASYSHIRAEQPSITDGVLDENIEGIDYHWYPTPAYGKNGLWRAKNMLSFIWSLWRDALGISQEFKPDLVIASSTYPMDIWPARRIAQFANAKLVYEVHDLWPLSPMELGSMSRWHPFIIWVQTAEDYAYRYADKVVSMLPKAKEYMQSRGMLNEKFVYVPNGIDVDEWFKPDPLPREVQIKLDALRANGLPLVGYAGTYGLANALDTLLEAGHYLKGLVQIVLLGTGPERDKLLSRVEKEGLTNVTILPSVPKRSIPNFLKAIDIAYIGLLPQPLFRFGISPNKLMDYMMAGKPILMSIEAGNDPVTEAECGITVLPGDPIAVAKAVRSLIALSPEALAEMGASGKRFILKNQTYKILAQQFLGLINDD